MLLQRIVMPLVLVVTGAACVQEAPPKPFGSLGGGCNVDADCTQGEAPVCVFFEPIDCGLNAPWDPCDAGGGNSCVECAHETAESNPFCFGEEPSTPCTAEGFCDEGTLCVDGTGDGDGQCTAVSESCADDPCACPGEELQLLCDGPPASCVDGFLQCAEAS